MKKMILAVFLLSLAGCGPSQSELDQARKKTLELESQVKALKSELDDIKFGANQLLTKAKIAYDSNQDGEAKRLLTDLLKRHPTSPESADAESLLAKVDARIAETEKQIQLAKEQKIKEERKALERITVNMRKDTDEIKGITWISHRNKPILANYISFYFGTNKNNAADYPLRVKIHYYGDDWLFVRSVTVKADDKVYELGRLDFERDNGSGSVWEWVDLPVKDFDMLNHWMSAKRVIVRLEGNQYYKDFTLSQKQQMQMREVYQAWKLMGGKQ